MVDALGSGSSGCRPVRVQIPPSAPGNQPNEKRIAKSGDIAHFLRCAFPCTDSALRRLLAAIETLAAVRRLALPVLQVNLGQNQINTTGTVSPCPSSDMAVIPNGAQNGGRMD